MPTTLTHKIAADNILRDLTDTQAKRIIEENKNAYYSGSQGGDIFLLYKFYFFLLGANPKCLDGPCTIRARNVFSARGRSM